MEQACQHVEAKIATLETEVMTLMGKVESTVDALGDLKHGDLLKQQVGDAVAPRRPRTVERAGRYVQRQWES